MKFLDCTLRDGGYYNNWDFDPAQAKRLIQALNRAGAQIIEVGYKTPVGQQQFYGLYRYCNEAFLPYISKKDQVDYAFMIDVKEFICEDEINQYELDKVILHTDNSPFSWVRLATHFGTVEIIPDLAKYFRDKGYRVGFNLMGGSLLSEEQIQRGAEIAGEAEVDVFYLADSFGSFYPEDIRRLIRFIKKKYSGKIGMHTHDNQGMAYANTLAALDEGVEFVDGTVTGMGRGAGNLMSEQFLIGYAEKFNDQRYNGNALLNVIEDYIQPMKNRFKWGYSPTYMYSGLNNIHPTYCQNLIESNRFTVEEISGILEHIPGENRKKFEPAILENAVKKQLKDQISDDKDVMMPFFNLDLIAYKSAVITARGSHAERHASNIAEWIELHDSVLIECNDTGFFAEDQKRFVTILNRVRLEKYLRHSSNSSVTLVSGFPVKSLGKSDGLFPFKIGEFNAKAEHVNIPDYDAGLYAIALAIKAGVKIIYLAGFDGFDNESENQSKELHLKQVAKQAVKLGVKISHITETNYSIFPQQSLYDPVLNADY